MAIAKVVLNGFESVLSTGNFPGTWYTEGTQHPYEFHGYFGRVLWCGLWDFHKDKFAIRLGPINVDKNTAFSTFPVQIPILMAYKHLNITVKGVKDTTYVVGSGTKAPSYQQLTTAEANVFTGAWAGNNLTDMWVPTQPVQTFELGPIATELAATSGWVNGGHMTFVFDFIQSDFSGFIRVPAMTYDTPTQIQVDYSSSAGTSITSVSGDNKFAVNEKNIEIITTGGVAAAKDLKLVNAGGASYPQVIAKNDGTKIYFNNVNAPAAVGYKLQFDLYGEIFSRNVEITAQAIELPTVTTGTAGIVMDCFEWFALSTPGTVEQVTGSGASDTSFWANQIIMGKWSNRADIAFKTEEIYIGQGSVIDYFLVELPVTNAYKRVDYNFYGVADPTAATISNTNKISTQSLTTATLAGSTSQWGGYNGTDNWNPSTNPVILDFKAIAQEIVNKGNWFSGSQMQFIGRHVRDLGGADGNFRIRSNENVDNPKILVRYGVTAPRAKIESIGGDNAINYGEVNVLCTGKLLNAVTTIQMEQAGVTQAQTILAKDGATLTFNFVPGALVVGKSTIFRYFDASGEAGFLPVTINTAGGGGTGTVTQTADGHEYAAPKPGISNPGTWQSDWEGTCAIGKVFYYHAGSEFWASATFGSLSIPQGSTLESVSLTWHSTGEFNAYKAVDFEIRAVKSTNVIGPSSLPSAQTLTTAKATVLHTDFPSYNDSDYWEPDVITIDLTAVVQEAVLHSSWDTNLKLVMIPTNYQFGDGYIVFNATESSYPKLSLSFNAGTPVKISNVNGDNTLRHEQTGIKIYANDTTGATNLKITQAGKQVSQTIKSNTGTQLEFDFQRGILGYGEASLSFQVDSSVITKTIALLPKAGRDYIVLSKVGLADDSLCYQSVPQCGIYDQFEFDLVSTKGFGVRIKPDGGQPYLLGGEGEDHMKFSHWRESDGSWTNNQTANFYAASYFDRFKVGNTSFRMRPVDTDFEPNTSSENWVRQNDIDANESWSDE